MTKEQEKQHLMNAYDNQSRVYLSDGELLEFWEFLKILPPASSWGRQLS